MNSKRKIMQFSRNQLLLFRGTSSQFTLWEYQEPNAKCLFLPVFILLYIEKICIKTTILAKFNDINLILDSKLFLEEYLCKNN